VKLLRDTVMAQPGVRAGYHMRSPRSGKGLSIVVFENQDAVEAVGKALSERPEDQRVGIDPDDVESYEVLSSKGRRRGQRPRARSLA
jgi:hypothetical protein